MTKIWATKEKLIKFWVVSYNKPWHYSCGFFFDFIFLLANYLVINIDTKVKYLLIESPGWLFVLQMIVYYALATKLKNTDYPKMDDRGSNATHVITHFQYDELDEHMTIVSKKE